MTEKQNQPCPIISIALTFLIVGALLGWYGMLASEAYVFVTRVEDCRR